MKKIVSVLVTCVLTLSLCCNVNAEMIKITPSAGFTKVDRYSEKEAENFILIYYNSTCSNSQKILPMVEDYAEEKNTTLYGVDYRDGHLSVSRIINSNIIAFPVVIAYNASTQEITGINEVTSREQFETFLDNALDAQNPSASIELQIGSKNMLCNGKNINLDVPATIIDNRTMVPLRAIFEALGAEVEWDNANRKITATRGNKTVELYINVSQIYVDGVSRYIDVAPMIVDNRTLVPVRAVSEAFGCSVEWINETQTVVIK